MEQLASLKQPSLPEAVRTSERRVRGIRYKTKHLLVLMTVLGIGIPAKGALDKIPSALKARQHWADAHDGNLDYSDADKALQTLQANNIHPAWIGTSEEAILEHMLTDLKQQSAELAANPKAIGGGRAIGMAIWQTQNALDRVRSAK